MLRKIIHCDADCFFAAIEARDDPNLRERPIAVGGSRDHRGVIATCNYDAREFGVRSAMSTAHAMRLCPDLIVVPPNMEKYSEASRVMRNIFYDYTDQIEPLSLDEAFLDVSESELCQGSATLIAQEIGRRVKETLGITVSSGIANSKFLAKIASDVNKPDGIFVIPPDKVEEFVMALSVRKIFGVGKATHAKLLRLGMETCADLRKLSIFELSEHFGSFGKQLYELSRGIDNRPVQPKQKRKSLSVENTYSSDLRTVDECVNRISALYINLKSRLNRMNTAHRTTKSFAKVKFSDFSVTTVEKISTAPRQDEYQALIIEAIKRKNLPVRLMGIGVRFIDEREDDKFLQLELFEKYPEFLPQKLKK